MTYGTAKPKGNVRELVRSYFEQARPTMLAALSGEGELTLLDGAMQELLRCTQRRTRVEDYRRCLAASKRALSEIELRSLGAKPSLPANAWFDTRQSRILESLRRLNAPAADAYEQGLLDLRVRTRKSWRGTAVEFREALRELLDMLAQDAEVTKQPGFKFEPEYADYKKKGIDAIRAHEKQIAKLTAEEPAGADDETTDSEE